MVLAFFSLVIAILPMFANLVMIWRLDRYEREPFRMVLYNFLWGGTGAIILSIILSIQMSTFLHFDALGDTLVVAPVVEEIIKGSFLLLIALNRNFDNITDGIVYGVAIGLGFGMTENFLYFLSAESMEQWAFMVIVRTLFSASLHALATGLTGAGIGLTKYQYHRARWPIRLLFICAAMFIHFFWNYSVSVTVETDFALGMGIGILFIVLGVVGLLVLMQIVLSYEHRLITHELREEVDSGLIPADHLRYLPFTSRRKYVGWLPIQVDPRQYILAATTLAFRKRQARTCGEKHRDRIEQEILQLRSQITEFLHPQSPALPAMEP